jgi:hypothetical protein
MNRQLRSSAVPAPPPLFDLPTPNGAQAESTADIPHMTGSDIVRNYLPREEDARELADSYYRVSHQVFGYNLALSFAPQSVYFYILESSLTIRPLDGSPTSYRFRLSTPNTWTRYITRQPCPHPRTWPFCS